MSLKNTRQPQTHETEQRAKIFRHHQESVVSHLTSHLGPYMKAFTRYDTTTECSRKSKPSDGHKSLRKWRLPFVAGRLCLEGPPLQLRPTLKWHTSRLSNRLTGPFGPKATSTLGWLQFSL